MSIGLVLGGGAPNLTLMSGALLALEMAGLEFKVISTTGAGLLAGLLYASPKKTDPGEDISTTRRKALSATQHLGINDFIYKYFPINYKVFQKPGPMAKMLSPAFNSMFLSPLPNETPSQSLMRDMMAFNAAMLMPSNLSFFSKGLCQAPPWMADIVDFENIVPNLGDTKFRIGAYCVDDQKDVSFDREEITVEHCKAALAMPMIYEPYKLVDPASGKAKTYLEGSAFNPLEINPDDVMYESDVDTIIFFDILGYPDLLDEPRNLLDAWVQSIIAPLIRLSELSVSQFKDKRDMHARDRLTSDLARLATGTDPADVQDNIARIAKNRDLLELVDLLGSAEAGIGAFNERAKAYTDANDVPGLKDLVDLAIDDYGAFARKREAFLKNREVDAGAPSPLAGTHSCRSELLRMPFGKHIPADQWPQILDWSNSNLTTLFRIGYETGLAFLEAHKERLESSMGKALLARL